MDDNDQVQEDSPVGAEVIKKDTPDQAPEEQSETTEDVEEEVKAPVYKDHLGRELTGEQLHEEYVKTQSYITRLEGEKKKWEESAQKETAEAISENPYLKDVDPNVREAIAQIVTPLIENKLQQKDAEAQKKAQNEAFTAKIEGLKTKYPGGNGKPKFDELKILAAMQDPTNDGIYDPEWMYMKMNFPSIVDFEIKQAMKGKSSGTNTEDTGGSTPRKPQGKTPKNWDDAGKSALSRMSS